jgi:hypothetical protein
MRGIERELEPQRLVRFVPVGRFLPAQGPWSAFPRLGGNFTAARPPFAFVRAPERLAGALTSESGMPQISESRIAACRIEITSPPCASIRCTKSSTLPSAPQLVPKQWKTFSSAFTEQLGSPSAWNGQWILNCAPLPVGTS